jgi:hypothetical protein
LLGCDVVGNAISMLRQCRWIIFVIRNLQAHAGDGGADKRRGGGGCFSAIIDNNPLAEIAQLFLISAVNISAI